MKQYIIILGKKFPKGHPKAGQETHFREKFLAGEKIHTLRSNYPFWEKAFKEINAGKACLSVREWSGVPYRSKQTEIARLYYEDGIGIQKARIVNKAVWCNVGESMVSIVPIAEVARYDGLSEEDFIEWLDDWVVLTEQVIIWFNGHRYESDTDKNRR